MYLKRVHFHDYVRVHFHVLDLSTLLKSILRNNVKLKLTYILNHYILVIFCHALKSYFDVLIFWLHTKAQLLLTK